MTLKPPTGANNPLVDAPSSVDVLRAAPLNVKDSPYNAVGDGSTDDTAAINAAITAAAAATFGNGGEVYIPPGLYKFTTLLYRSDVHVRGAGLNSTQLTQASGTTDVLARPASSVSALQRLEMSHLTLTAFTNQSANTGGIDLFRTSKSVLDRVKVSYFKNFGIRGKGGPDAQSGDSMRNEFHRCEIANGQSGSVGYLATNGSDLTGVVEGGSHPDGTMFFGGLMQNTPTAWKVDAPPSDDPLVFSADCLTVFGTQVQSCPIPVDIQGGWGHRFIGCRWENTSGAMELRFGAGTASSPVYDVGFLGCMFAAHGNQVTITDPNGSSDKAYWMLGCQDYARQTRFEIRDPLTFLHRQSPYKSNSLYRDLGDQLRWRDHNGGDNYIVMSRVRSVTANTNATTLDRIISVDASAGPVTVSFSTAVDQSHQQFWVKKTDSSGNAVTLDPAGSETIDGATTKVLSSQWASVHVVSNGANWLTI